MRIKVLSSYLSRHIEFHVLWIKKKHIRGQEHCFDTVESCWESDLTNKYILRSLGCLNLTGGVVTFLICGMFVSPICLSKYAPNGEFARRLCQRLHCSWKPLGYRCCIRSFTMSNITSRLRPTPHQSIHHKFSVHILSVVLEHWHIVVVLMHLPSSNYNHFIDKICWETLS